MARPIQSTMQEVPLTITDIFRRAASLFRASQVVTFEGDTSRRADVSEVIERVARLAAGLRHLGIKPGDRVGTFCWNHQEHLEAYFAVPLLGAVLHLSLIHISERGPHPRLRAAQPGQRVSGHQRQHRRY